MVDLRLPKINIESKPKRKALTPDYRIKVAKAHDWKCGICKKEIKPDQDWQVDHKRRKISSRELTDVRPVHTKCHKKKNALEAKKRAKTRSKSLLDDPLKGFKI